MFYCKIIFLFALIFCSSCARKSIESASYKPSPYTFDLEFDKDEYNIPLDNPMTIEGVELGRRLFYDNRLSGDSLRPFCCASCHKQENAFECGLNKFEDGFPIGNSGHKSKHVMLPLFNLVFNNVGYFWNGKIDAHSMNIESTVLMAIKAPHEFDSEPEKVINLISRDTIYQKLFFKAFGTCQIDIDNISKAIAQFVRSIVSFNSKFDKFMAGELELSKEELNGFYLFSTEKADCFHCHGGPQTPLWTTNIFSNNALDVEFDTLNDRYSVTKNIMDIGAYRVPTVRNIAFTAPYMHDGRFKTLDEVLQFYNNELKRSPFVDATQINVNHGGMHLTDSQISDLKAFLLTLSDSSLLTNKKYSNPW